MTPFAARITTAPRAHDERRGLEAVEAVGAQGSAVDLLKGAAGSSPYLADLMRREAEWLADALAASPEETFADLLKSVDPEAGMREVAVVLRRLKRRAALLIALADLGGVWSLDEVTGALSDLADRAVALAFDASMRVETSGPLKGMTAEEAGLIALAMGKGGARELNYSSDIDLVLFHENERFDEATQMEAKPRWTKIVQRVVKLLSEQTAEGYVFRTDLRLRPNPSVTPLCMPVEAAERYYEGHGRTWERAAFVKARPCAGDIAAGDAFLDWLKPFIWRRHLDFAALEDINDIRAKIRDAKGLAGRNDLPGYDLKLGPGGIREIEFFAQTQQLALGGRNPELRERRTLDALAALARFERIDAETRDALTDAYCAHRALEHRLQMVADQQTHAMPTGEEARDQVAALGGWPDRAAMEEEVSARLADTRARVTAFFGEAKPSPSKPVEAPEDAFKRPELIREMVDRWTQGGVAATRDQRARRKFRALAPAVLARLAAAGDPDDAALHFDRFITGLPAGVQLFSLFEANPMLLDLLGEICAASPKLAEYLGRNSRVLDAVLDRDFFAPLPGLEALSADLETALTDASDYESVLDGVRIWARERHFRLGVQVLRGVADEAEAGRAFTAIAEACLGALKPAVEAEFARRHGPPPGRGAVVIGMGKMGSAEMTASSDLDLIVVYDAGDAEASEGPKPLSIQQYSARLTKMLVSSLTTPTAEGTLYEVDMRLRPSGGQGPVAVSLESFRHYQMNEAWTWEHMALTRARPLAGEASLQAEVAEIIETVLSAPRDPAKTRADVAEMRGRLVAAHGGARDELWALKHGAGGLMDIEFVAQNGALSASLTGVPAAPGALARLADCGDIDADAAATLIEAHRLQSRLQHVERVALAGSFRAETAGAGLKAALARAGGVATFDEVEAALERAKTAAVAIADEELPIP
ncbi:MAG: bifunctional [glutamine synthetase] adenylyltransferase/[glutamine synthetase]-adenylyl-L-tyrosine phosphorylase [Pseudomonadota bacterium]